MLTPLGFGYYLPNQSTGKAVEFDDCQQTTGRMIDYARQILEDSVRSRHSKVFHKAASLEQAERQVQAAGDRQVR